MTEQTYEVDHMKMSYYDVIKIASLFFSDYLQNMSSYI